MSTRLTVTEKWQNDAWFITLGLKAKLLFLYLCDVCDPAGFVEKEDVIFCRDTGISDEDIDGVLMELASPYKGASKVYIRSIDGASDREVVWIANRVKVQMGSTDLTSGNKFIPVVIRHLLPRLSIFPEISKTYHLPDGVSMEYPWVLKKKKKIKNNIKNNTGECEGGEFTPPIPEGDSTDEAGAKKDAVYALAFTEPMIKGRFTYASWIRLKAMYPKVKNYSRAMAKFLLAVESSPSPIQNPTQYLGAIMSKQEAEDLSSGATVDAALKDGTTKNKDGLVWRYDKWRRPTSEMTAEEIEEEDFLVADGSEDE